MRGVGCAGGCCASRGGCSPGIHRGWAVPDLFAFSKLLQRRWQCRACCWRGCWCVAWNVNLPPGGDDVCTISGAGASALPAHVFVRSGAQQGRGSQGGVRADCAAANRHVTSGSAECPKVPTVGCSHARESEQLAHQRRHACSVLKGCGRSGERPRQLKQPEITPALTRAAGWREVMCRAASSAGPGLLQPASSQPALPCPPCTCWRAENRSARHPDTWNNA